MQLLTSQAEAGTASPSSQAPDLLGEIQALDATLTGNIAQIQLAAAVVSLGGALILVVIAALLPNAKAVERKDETTPAA